MRFFRAAIIILFMAISSCTKTELVRFDLHGTRWVSWRYGKDHFIEFYNNNLGIYTSGSEQLIFTYVFDQDSMMAACNPEMRFEIEPPVMGIMDATLYGSWIGVIDSFTFDCYLPNQL